MLSKIWQHREGVLIGVFLLKLISHEDILEKVSEGALALCSAAGAYSRSPISLGAEAPASFFLSTQLLGPNWIISPHLEESVRIKEEVDKRKQTLEGIQWIL